MGGVGQVRRFTLEWSASSWSCTSTCRPSSHACGDGEVLERRFGVGLLRCADGVVCDVCHESLAEFDHGGDVALGEHDPASSEPQVRESTVAGLQPDPAFGRSDAVGQLTWCEGDPLLVIDGSVLVSSGRCYRHAGYMRGGQQGPAQDRTGLALLVGRQIVGRRWIGPHGPGPVAQSSAEKQQLVGTVLNGISGQSVG